MNELSRAGADERRILLLGVKLRALVSDHLGAVVAAAPVGFGAGAAMVVDGAAWVLVDGPADRRLGAALAWALRRGATSLDVIAERGGGTIARRALGFDHPISIWFAEDRVLLPVVPDAVLSPEPPPSDHLTLSAMIEAAGATVRVEHGVVTGEVRGLEMCRVVAEPTTGTFAELADFVVDPQVAPADRAGTRPPGDGVMLEVGVGANDREAFQLVHGDVPTPDALTHVVSAVAEHRTGAAAGHPLNRMAPERFLRWQVEEEPERLGLRSLVAVEPPVPRRSMKYAEPCVAAGVDLDGRSVIVVFSSGVDLDVVPFTADVIVGLIVGLGVEPADPPDDEPRVIIALPERDVVAITRDLAALLRRPVELVGLGAGD